MKLKLVATLILLLFIFELFAQQSQNNYQISADSILIKLKKDKQFKDYASKAHDISLKHGRSGDFKNALKYALLEVKYKDFLPLEKQKNSLFNLGLFFFKTKNYSKSIEAYNKVIDSFEIDEKTYRAYCENARNYSELGDYFHATNYFKKGLLHPERISTRRLPGIYLNYIIVNHKIGSKNSIAKNKILLKKVDSLAMITSLSNNNLYSLYTEYGLFYKNKSHYNFNKSRNNYLKIFNKSINERNHKMVVKSLNNLGVLYNKEKKDSALFYINKGIEYASNNDDLLRLYINKAEYYFIAQKQNVALKILQNALQLPLLIEIDSSITFSPNIKTFITSKNKNLSLLTLKEKAKYILESKDLSNDKKLLQTAYESIFLADKLIDNIRTNSIESQSKLLWQEEASEIFMLGVKACFKLNKPDKSFYFIEKNKAILLLENITKNKSRLNSNIPVNVLQKEQDFKKEIFALENILLNDSSKKQKDQYHSLKIEYNNFIQSLKSNYPEYYNSKLPVLTESIKSVKKNLDDNTTILQYILNEDNGYILAITKDKSKLVKIAETKNLKTEINDYLKHLHNPLNTTEEFENYNSSSNKLYNKLFPFKNTDILKSKLLIVPDYTLHNLPFESLKRDNKYLIEDFNIAYTYSVSFLEKNKKANRKAEQESIVFAPKTFNYDNLKILSKSEDEAEKIGQLLNSKILIDTAATKTNFFKKINDYKIIHLATHANANDSIAPWIAFKNEKLYLNELYTTKNQAELVVLNACNSSIGKINSGEGVFSLARGFFYSGTNSVISSLWNVNDKSNAEITTSFYKHLKDGKTKSTSLRQAKLDYLNSHNLSEKSPYYWSSLILIGDDSAINFSNNNWLYILLASFLLLLLLLLKKKRKNRVTSLCFYEQLCK